MEVSFKKMVLAEGDADHQNRKRPDDGDYKDIDNRPQNRVFNIGIPHEPPPNIAANASADGKSDDDDG